MGTNTMKGEFRIRRMKAREHGTEYFTFQLVGIDESGRRIRLRFKERARAEAEKLRREIRAANRAAIVQPINTRLTEEQVSKAEACYRRLNGVDLEAAVEWYLANYRPPVAPKPLAEAIAAFVATRKGRVEDVHLADVACKLALLQGWFPQAHAHEITASALSAMMEARDWAPKSWNNVRGVFHAFFDYCRHDLRRWREDNPVAQIDARKVVRGLPTIESAGRIKELFEFLETYTGGTRRPRSPGFLVPYFALATFAGMRPSVPAGEIWKLALSPERDRLLNLATSVS